MDIFKDEAGFKHAYVVVPEWGGRDKDKMFYLSEWPAERAEDWGWRALIAYNRGGGKIPPEAIGGGMEAIFWLFVEKFAAGYMQADEAIPIWKELLECVQIVRDQRAKDVKTGKPVAHALMPTDIMEVKTRLWLRSEVLELHTNFSAFDIVSTLISAIMTKRATSTTRTSQGSSESSSVPA